jgi:hypothetical protein
LQGALGSRSRRRRLPDLTGFLKLASISDWMGHAERIRDENSGAVHDHTDRANVVHAKFVLPLQTESSHLRAGDPGADRRDAFSRAQRKGDATAGATISPAHAPRYQGFPDLCATAIKKDWISKHKCRSAVRDHRIDLQPCHHIVKKIWSSIVCAGVPSGLDDGDSPRNRRQSLTALLFFLPHRRDDI